MNKRIIVFFAAIALFLGGYTAGNSKADSVYAQGNNLIPKAWGTCKGAYTGFLIFEAPDGTIRLFEIGGNRVYTYNRN